MILGQERLIIVTGPAHSGTTILTRLLAQHPDVFLATGGREGWLLENDWLPHEDSAAIAELLEKHPGRRVLLKRPWNLVSHGDWMARELPRAKYLCCDRPFNALAASWSKPTSFVADQVRRDPQLQREVYDQHDKAAAEFAERVTQFLTCYHDDLLTYPEVLINLIRDWLDLAPFTFDVSEVSKTKNIKHQLIPEIASGQYTTGSRGNGFTWAIDPNVLHSGLDLKNHEDWIYDYLRVPADGVFVDVGAFVGTHAIRVAKQCGCRTIAFEPVKEHAQIFYANRLLNESGVELIQKAVGDFVGVIGFRADGPAESRVPQNPNRINTTVPITTLDRALATLDRLDVVLIDVEGLEVRVLNGGSDVLRRLRPRIVVEVHSHYAGCESNGNLIEDWCRANGYTSRRIWENSPAYYYVELTSS